MTGLPVVSKDVPFWNKSIYTAVSGLPYLPFTFNKSTGVLVLGREIEWEILPGSKPNSVNEIITQDVFPLPPEAGTEAKNDNISLHTCIERNNVRKNFGNQGSENRD